IVRLEHIIGLYVLVKIQIAEAGVTHKHLI
ncbi:hypothetical protein LCGC14_1389720, partial [marine sediment metagenome]